MVKIWFRAPKGKHYKNYRDLCNISSYDAFFEWGKFYNCIITKN